MKDIRQNWKALAAKRLITKEDIAALCIYRALVKEQGKEGCISRLRKSFIPITNQKKLNNGQYAYSSAYYALLHVKYSTVMSWIDEEDKEKVLALAKEICQGMHWGKEL
jgi:hypothetical protein